MKNKDFIVSQFEKENINAPDSLSEENIKARLEQGTSVNNIVKVNKNKKRVLKPLAAVAACIAIVITSVVSGNAIRQSRIDKAIAKSEKDGLVYFTSYDELENFSDKLYSKPERGFNMFGVVTKDLYEKSVSNESAADAADGAESHSTTYTQIEDVDEADIIKTDGEYIYFIDTSESTLVIYSAKDGMCVLASKTFNDSSVLNYRELYLNGDRLYILGTESKYNKKKYTTTYNTIVKAYDVSDRTKIRELDTFKQSGEYSTSRMVGDSIYVVSTTYATSKRFVPCCTDEDGELQKIPAKDICAFKDCTEPDYAVIGAIDTKNGLSRNKKVRAVMGGANEVFCTTENIYIACTTYTDSHEVTGIVKYKLSGATSLKQVATGNVRGSVNNQFSFDEKDGYLRVATTVNNDINKLFVLDEKLDLVGSVGGYAKGEHIEAVKYIGDKAYVITYETTDPLFIIDLSNPRDPKITGKVKIDGFSTNLVPVGEDKLMGIGYSTESTEWGEATNGVKIVLFDISNDNKPRVLDTKVYSGATSPAQEDHKAIMQNREEGYLAIPIVIDNYEDEEVYDDAEEGEVYDEPAYYGESGKALVFTEKDGKIKVLKEYKSDNSIDRIVYIGNHLYAVDTTAESIESFTLGK
ncbi:MAG: beta-propeller domain-containing protein [Eubacterium sp.]|nr:beta-propeller domain-containing protein [Eubacterium sp.]